MINIGIDNQTGEVIFEENGSRISNPSDITYIKRHSNWKERVYKLSINLKKEIDFNIENKRTIHTRVPKMLTDAEIKKKISSLICKSYIIVDYCKKKDEEIENEAKTASRKYAECNASSNIFKKKKQILELYNKKLPEFIEFYKAKDLDEEKKYYAEENKIKIQRDFEYKTQYDTKKNYLLDFISDDEEKIEKELNNCLKDIENNETDVHLSGSYKSFPNNTCSISIHLPDLSCIECRIGNMLASGKISIKQRKVNDIKNDWKLFCNGLILYVVGSVFNVNTCIKNVCVLATYTELNKAFGSHSVEDFANCSFDRCSFENINFSNINPIDTIQMFSTETIPVNKQKVKNKKVQNVMQKSPFEIECYSELSNNSLAIINMGLKVLFACYGDTIFLSNETNRFSSAIKDVFPMNEAERQVVELLLKHGCFSEFISASDKNVAEARIKEILAGNTLDGDVFLSNLKSMLGGN
jgi:hypothetical protein